MSKKMLKFLSIFLCLTVVLSITGCFSKKSNTEQMTVVDTTPVEDSIRQEIEGEYAEYLDSLEKQVSSMKEQLAVYDGRYKSSEAFKGKSILQAGSIAFNKVSDKVVLDKTIIKSSMEQAGLESTIHLGNKFSLNPLNWITKLSGSQVSLSISNTAYGDLNFYKPSSRLKVDDIYDYVIKKFFEANDLEELSTRDIFISNKKIGKEATSRMIIHDSTANGFNQSVPALTLFDSEQLVSYGLTSDSDVPIIINIDGDKEVDAYFRLGCFYSGGYLVTYNFIIETENGSILVDNLINSIKQGSNSVYLN